MIYYSNFDFYTVRDAVAAALPADAVGKYEISTCITQALNTISRHAPALYFRWHDTQFPYFDTNTDTANDFAISERFTDKTETFGNQTAWIGGISDIWLSRIYPVGLPAVGGVPATLENTDKVRKFLSYFDSTCRRVLVDADGVSSGDQLQMCVYLSYTLSQHNTANATTLPRTAYQTLLHGAIYFAFLSWFGWSAQNADDFYSWTNTSQREKALNASYKLFLNGINQLRETIQPSGRQSGTYNHFPDIATADDVPEISIPNWDGVHFG